MNFAFLTIVVAAVGAEISVQPSRHDRAHPAYQRAVENLDRPAERTIETLKRHDLERRYRKDLDGAFASLENLAREKRDPELVYALAELSWVEGKRNERWRKAAALDRFIASAVYAYDFLTDPDFADPGRGSDPRYRTAMDLYNASLERLIRAVQANGQLMPDVPIRVKGNGREQTLRVTLANSPWTQNDIDKIILASDFEVLGLPTRTYQYGLGVPLIGVRLADDPAKEAARFYPPEMAYALTAILKPTARLRDGSGGAGPRECSLELIDPVRARTVCPPANIPVESDLTTPLAYMWARTDLNRFRWTGLLRPGEAIGRANLMLIRPYERGKIPVVMVHGLASSPLAWIAMINELLRDPVIQQKYQFMLYVYPTGVPFPIAGALLRDSLRQAGAIYNPKGQDPAFDQMVLLGHSMGGLLSHAMVVDSEDKFWQLNSDRRFSEIVGPKEVLDELSRYMFFKPVPCVRRVVFLATPHRGSELSRSVVGRVSSTLISEPDQISKLLARLVRDNPDTFSRRQFRRLPNSIETLEPIVENSPSVLKALSEMKPNPAVTFHSIIGSLRPGGVDQTTDGVVPYSSAHIKGVESELLVRSDHGVQKDPEAIQETRRILLEHLATAMPPRTALGVPEALP